MIDFIPGVFTVIFVLLLAWIFIQCNRAVMDMRERSELSKQKGHIRVRLNDKVDDRTKTP